MNYDMLLTNPTEQKNHSDAIMRAIRAGYVSEKDSTLRDLLIAADLIKADQVPDKDAEKKFTTVSSSGVLPPSKPKMSRDESIRYILTECKRQGLSKNQAAYVLATAQKESTFNPSAQLWDWAPPAEAAQIRAQFGKYYGRGYVQLTGSANYSKFSKIMGLPLVENPDLALEPANSVFIIVYGMKHGSFTGATLAHYINASKAPDFLGARIIVNDDKFGPEIAQYAEDFVSLVNRIWDEV